MNVLKALTSFLRSRTLTVWMLAIFVLYYLTSAVWSKEAFATFISNISHRNVFRLGYILFVLNIFFRILAHLQGLRASSARFWLRLPLFAGLVLFLLSFFLSLNVRQTVWLLRGEGDPVEIPWETTAYHVVRIKPALKERSLKTDESAIFDYEPGMTIRDGTGRDYTISAFPPVSVGSSYIHILNFGIGPGVELKRKGETLTRGYVPLRLTPFGNVDSFQMRPFPYTIYLSILPNRVISKGRESAFAYDLKQPLYRVEIVRGDRVIAKGDTDRFINFEGDMSLHFTTPSDWALLEVVFDPLYPGYVAVLVLLIGGMVLYPFSYLGRREQKRIVDN